MKKNSLRVGLYARVSTNRQDVEIQLHDLRHYCKVMGYNIIEEFIDDGVSTKSKKRPGRDRLLDAAFKRRIDAVIVWRFDRFARSVKELVDAMEDFRLNGVKFISYQENIDTDNILGRALLVVSAAMAQLEHDATVERVKAGLQRARAKGKVLGRPRCVIDQKRFSQLTEQGLSLGKIAKELGVSKATVHRISRGRQNAD